MPPLGSQTSAPETGWFNALRYGTNASIGDLALELRNFAGRGRVRGEAMHDVISWLRAGAATHVGKVRQHNEDSFLIQPNHGVTDSGLWAVADGMGGHEAGDLASQTIVEELRSVGAPATAAALLASCEERIVAANSRLRDIARQRGGGLIGSTVAVLLVYDRYYACVWSGDSRIYRARDAGIEQVTVDHTEAQELLDAGKLTPEQARTWPRRNVITRAIGVQDDPELEMTHGPLLPGDTFVLCSDGLTAHVEDGEILACATEGEPQRACDRLVALTLDRGAVDNVTVVVVRYDLEAPLGATAAAPAGAANDDIWG
jgi:serine/threonine protein phosphatase PrpC